MKLTIAAVGKLKAGPESELYDRYAKRISQAGKQAAIGPLDLIEITESRKNTARERRGEEASVLMDKITQPSRIVALDEKGDALTSEEIARFLQKERDNGAASLVFAIGGPDGHGEAIRETSSLLSLGAITLPHGLARVVLAEQLYRAVTLLTGHPYHRA